MGASRTELVEALRPLAALAKHYEDTDASGPAFIQVGSQRPPLKLTGADCHRAKRLVEGEGDPGTETLISVSIVERHSGHLDKAVRLIEDHIRPLYAKLSRQQTEAYNKALHDILNVSAYLGNLAVLARRGRGS